MNNSRITHEKAMSYNHRGEGNFLHQKYKDALLYFDEAIRLIPDCPTFYNNRGKVKHELGRYDEAIADYDETIHLMPEDAEAHYRRGMAKWELGEVSESAQSVHLALSIAWKNKQYKHLQVEIGTAILLRPNLHKAITQRAR